MAHEPMAMAHFGSGIMSQSFFTRGAILTVMVPAMTIIALPRGSTSNGPDQIAATAVSP